MTTRQTRHIISEQYETWGMFKIPAPIIVFSRRMTVAQRPCDPVLGAPTTESLDSNDELAKVRRRQLWKRGLSGDSLSAVGIGSEEGHKMGGLLMV